MDLSQAAKVPLSIPKALLNKKNPALGLTMAGKQLAVG
jgi:hypothetical protein